MRRTAMIQVEELKQKVLPALFAAPEAISEYGRIGSESRAQAQLARLLEGEPITRLASGIGVIVAKLTDADPRKLAAKPGFLKRFTGQAVESTVRYQLARAELETLIDQAEGAAQGVRDAHVQIRQLSASHEEEMAAIRAYIQAGREYLDEHPEAGVPTRDALAFDNPRERFARRLANLSALLASHEMSVTQMRLMQAQAIDLLDRFKETVRILVPVWRQHALAMTSSRHLNPDMVQAAVKAHEALTESLSRSMKGLS